MSSFRLGLRLLVRGGRSGAIRSVSLGLGVAATVLVVLALLSVPGVANRQAEREGAMFPVLTFDEEVASTAPLRATFDEVGLDGRQIQRLAIAPTGASPFTAPTWMGAIPVEGEVVVSPALLTEIATDPLAAAMFPQTIIGEIGKEALVAPNTLAAVVGADASDFDPRSGATGLGVPDDGQFDYRTLRLVIAVIVLFVLAPLSALIATSARLSARSTERRLASLRLMGLNVRRTRSVVAVETATVALAGAAVGVAAWSVLAPVSQRVGVDGLRWWASDIALSPLLVAGVVVAVVVASAVIAVLGSNPSLDNPVSTRRNSATAPKIAWRAATLVAGVMLLIASRVLATNISDELWYLLYIASNAVMALGLVVAAPVLSHAAAFLLDRSAAPSAALAARRLRFEPGAIGRVIAAMLIVVFAGGFAQALSAILSSTVENDAQVSTVADDGPVVLSIGASVEPNLTAVADVDGVTSVAATTYSFATDQPGLVLVADCASLVDLSVSTDQAACDDAVPQYLASELLRPDGAPLAVNEDQVERVALELDRLGIDITPDREAPLASDIVRNVRKNTTTTGGDVRISPDLLRDGEPRAAIVSFAIADGASPDLVAAAVRAIEPAGTVSGLIDIGRLRQSQAFALLLSAAVLAALVISLAAAAMAASDRSIERRRNAAHLAALGVPGAVQRRAEALTTAAPLMLGVIAAVGGAALSNSAFLASKYFNAPFAVSSIAVILVVGLIASALAAAASAAATTTVPDPTGLRTE